MHLAGDQFGLENWWYSAYSYGCDKEYYQNLTTGSVNGTVVVTQTGNCPNIQKVFLAHEFGASGIVIVNNRINMNSVMKMNLGELFHRGIEIFAASISLNTFKDQIYNELINAQNTTQKIFLRTVSDCNTVRSLRDRTSNEKSEWINKNSPHLRFDFK